MRIKDIGIVVTGKTPSTNNLANYSTKDCMFVTPDDILDDTYIVRKTRRYISHAGLQSILSNSIKGISIAVTCIGEVGRCAILHDSCATNQQINSITNIDTKIVEPVALYYWFKCCGKQLINYASQTVMPIVSKSTFENIQIELPDIEHQKALVNMLSHVDDLIENNKNLSNKLSDIVNLTYNYWFVQFDFPDENGRPYKSSGGKMIYNEQLKQEIPDGWEAVKFSSIAKIISGFPFKSDDYTGNGKYKIITIKNVQDSNIDSSSANSIDTLPDNLPNNCKLHVGDLLISLTGNVGRCGQVFEDNLLLNQRVGKLMVRNKVNENFAISTISSLQQQKRMEQLSNGSSQANLSPVQAVDFYIALPPSELLAKFNDIARPARKLSLSLQQESKLLASLRDWLLPMLMNGQAEIRERKEASNDQV